MSELWHCLILLGVLEVFWFYATLIIFIDNNNNNNNGVTLLLPVKVFLVRRVTHSHRLPFLGDRLSSVLVNSGAKNYTFIGV